MRRIALALILMCAAWPAFAGTPLFDAFKAICVDTGADPAAVKKAVEAAGGVSSVPAAFSSMPPVFQSWRLRDLNVFAAAPNQSAAGRGRTSCDMTSLFQDQPSLARLRAWAGVPPDTATPTSWIYTFQNIGGKHLPMPNGRDPSYRKALTSGRVWVVALYDMGRGDIVKLAHVMPQ